jgi:hypothetical protein
VVNQNNAMKMKLLLLAACITFAGLLSSSFLLHAQESKAAARFEYAIVKWDGPDRLYLNIPNKFEVIRLGDQNVTIPKEAENEEFCLATACNIMARTGWEPVTLDSRRVLFRRSMK